MSDPTQLIISIQGKRGSGKSTMSEKIIEPLLKAIGITVSKKTDEKNGVFLTAQVPFGFAEGCAETFTRPMLELIVKEAIAKDRAGQGARVSFKNADEIMDLLSKRKDLEEFLTGDEDGDVAQKIAQQALSARLRQVLEPKSVIALLRQDTRVQIEEIDLQLEKLGFDTSDKELPTA